VAVNAQEQSAMQEEPNQGAPMRHSTWLFRNLYFNSPQKGEQ